MLVTLYLVFQNGETQTKVIEIPPGDTWLIEEKEKPDGTKFWPLILQLLDMETDNGTSWGDIQSFEMKVGEK